MIENRGAFIDLGNVESTNGRNIFTVFANEEVLGDIRVLNLELFKFFVSEGLIIATLPQSREEVSAWDLFLIDFLLNFLGFGLSFCRSFLVSNVQDCAILEQKINNLILIVFLSKLDWGVASLILVGDIDALLEQEFDHFVATLLDCVVDGSLTIGVNSVEF